jgi:hypothetical protein
MVAKKKYLKWDLGDMTLNLVSRRLKKYYI